MNTRSKVSSVENTPIAIINHILCDRSGSMSVFNGEHIKLNEQLLKNTKSLARTTSIPNYVTFTSFDHEVDTVIDNKNIMDLEIPSIKKSLTPRGQTRFIDTVINSIINMEKQKKNILNSLPRELKQLEPKIQMILNCTTDGLDNISKNTSKTLKTYMEKFRNAGGQAILLTANIDSFYTSNLYGFSKDSAITVDNTNPTAIKFAYGCIEKLSRDISTGEPLTPFTPLQRMRSQPLYTSNFNSDSEFETDEELSPPPPLLRRVNNLPIRTDTKTNSETETETDEELSPPPPLLRRVNNLPICTDTKTNSDSDSETTYYSISNSN